MWFLKFDNSSSIHDFEINWKFLKNKIVDDKKENTLDFPQQKGFNICQEEKEILPFYFKSTNLNRKYVLSFDSDTPIMNSKSVGYVKVDLMNAKPEVYVSNTHLNAKGALPLVLDSKNAMLKVKRTSRFSLQVQYKLDAQVGDCDFDSSFCNYTIEPEASSVDLNQEWVRRS